MTLGAWTKLKSVYCQRDAMGTRDPGDHGGPEEGLQEILMSHQSQENREPGHLKDRGIKGGVGHRAYVFVWF